MLTQRDAKAVEDSTSSIFGCLAFPEPRKSCVQRLALGRVDAAGDSINSFDCQRFLARHMQLAFCLFISSIALLYLWRSRLTSRVNSWNFLSNSSLINFSLIASMDCNRLVSCERKFAISELS